MSSYSEAEITYSYPGVKVTKTITPDYTREWNSEKITLHPGDSVTMTAVSKTPSERVTVSIIVNNNDELSSVGYGHAKIVGVIH